jgi:hypothetical protein
MAEIGLVSGIISLAGVGAKLAKTLYQVADTIGSAGAEARLIAAEVSLFSHSLTAVSKLIDHPTPHTAKVCEVAEVSIAACRAVLQDVAELLEELQPIRGRPSKNTFLGVCAQAQWPLKRPRVEFLRASLASFKGTLTLLVASMDLTEAKERAAPDGIRYLIASRSASRQSTNQQQGPAARPGDHAGSRIEGCREGSKAGTFRNICHVRQRHGLN